MSNRNAHYWFDHGKRSQLAKQHTEWMETHTSRYIEDSVRNSQIHYHCSEMNDNRYLPKKYDHTQERLVCMDTVSAIYRSANYDKFISVACDVGTSTICALNFASFKHPGGMFLKGSCAQEEMLCHESNLYNILVRMENTYYKENQKPDRNNRSLYQDSLIYTPNVLFVRRMTSGTLSSPVECDIITCAAPNASAAVRYYNVSHEEISYCMKQRILGVLNAACHHNVEDLILGAFGCGVFGNDPHLVASTFHSTLKEVFDGFFRNVIYAVPDERSINYKAFQKVINDRKG